MNWELSYDPQQLRFVELRDLLGVEGLSLVPGECSLEDLALGKTPGDVPLATLGEARDFLRENLPKGVSCPCCGQWAQVHRWGMKPMQAVGLLLLAWFHETRPEHRQKFVHVTRFFAALGLEPKISTLLPTDFPKLRHWGLLEPGSRGFYRLTQRGLDFVAGKLRVPEAILTYNDAFLGFDGSVIDIYEALGGFFDLRTFEYAKFLDEIDQAYDVEALVAVEGRLEGHPEEATLKAKLYERLDDLAAIAA